MSNNVKAKFLCCSFQTDKPVKYTHSDSDTVSFSVEIPDGILFEKELKHFEVL
nr:MAG TPA: hypothetical protein [Caudoviricetes sp.]